MSLAIVLSADTKGCMYRSCGKCCKAVRGGEARQAWCEQCKKEVGVVLKYSLKVTIGMGPKTSKVCMFDEEAAAIMGGPPSAFHQLAQRHPGALEAAEELLVGQTVEIETKKNKNPQGDDKVVRLRTFESFSPVIPELARIFGEGGGAGGGAHGGSRPQQAAASGSGKRGAAEAELGEEAGGLADARASQGSACDSEACAQRAKLKKGTYALCPLDPEPGGVAQGQGKAPPGD